MRAREIDLGVSSSRLEAGERSTTDSADIVVGTIKGDPFTVVVGFGQPDPPTY